LATDTAATEGQVLSADGTRLAYRTWLQPQARHTFAVAHGLGEHSGRYAAFAQAMAARGMATYALDLRGHGNSQGQRGHLDSWGQWTEDIAAFVGRVESQTSGEVIPLGHSFGGAAMLSTVLAGKLKSSRRFIVSSPALKLKAAVPQWKASLGAVTSRLVPRLAMNNEVHPGTVSRIPEVVEAYRADPLVHAKISSRMYTEWTGAARDVLAHADQIQIPFLILAGDDDRLIDPSGSEQLHAKTPRLSTLEILPGRYHEPFNDLGSDEVFDIIARWVKG
jgi:alpha-beta hydrolase superfamily lysophospholipase